MAKPGRKPNEIKNHAVSVTMPLTLFKMLDEVRWEHRKTMSELVSGILMAWAHNEGLFPAVADSAEE